MKHIHRVLGVMAGSSMDGLDVCLVEFASRQGQWYFETKWAKTIKYPPSIYGALKEWAKLSVEDQKRVNGEFARWCSKAIDENVPSIPFDLVGYHGHTVLHDPSRKISWQLGNGQIIANDLNTPTIADFRSLDVELGGQGAPLVPMGDFELFSDYDLCLNLGGIANVSVKSSKTAWDICPGNQVLNFFAEKLGMQYDNKGKQAQLGIIDQKFLSRIRSLEFFRQQAPKSLPNDYIPQELLNQIAPIDGLATYCHFIATQLANDLRGVNGKLLVTGGGAFNDFLIGEIKTELNHSEIIVPESSIVDFKESIVFAFLGLLKLKGQVNVLSSVTGASRDTCSGVIYRPE